MEPSIRPFRGEDAPACRAILAQVLPAYGLKVDWEKTDRDLHEVEAVYLAKGGAFWVVEQDGRMVGMGGLERTGEATAEIRKMYFLPELRGKGYGRRLLDTMVAFARTRGISTLTLETASPLKEAMRLYERYGFVLDPSLLHTSRCDKAYRLNL